MDKMDIPSVSDSRKSISRIEAFLANTSLNIPHQDLVFTRCLNESWFSNTLAWLLNPKGAHGFGVRFIQEFMKTAARKRSSEDDKYHRKGSLFKWGKTGRGSSVTGLRLGNASVIREFYLAKSIEKRNDRGSRYCDVVVIDLDSQDSLFLVIENKLFSCNHPFQLDEYYQVVEDKFKRAKIREYVYLTINGAKPFSFQRGGDANSHRFWIRMSWGKDILEILNLISSGIEHKEIVLLKELLVWFQKNAHNSLQKQLDEFRNTLIMAASDCLLEELVRLGKDKPGRWKLEKQKEKGSILKHTSYPKTPLFIELLPNFSITVQSRRKKGALFEKIIVPFGARTDQIFNLLDIAARDIYHYHFAAKTSNYLSDRRRLTRSITQKKKAHKYIFDFVCKYQHQLKTLLLFSERSWIAQKFEIEKECF